MAFHKVPLEDFVKEFSATTELSSVALGGRVVSVSDEFFAQAFHLLLVEPAPSLKGQFGPNGALYSGWESRRHNPAYDWCIIQLGTTGSVSGFDVDTSHFNGNEAPEVSVSVLSGAPSEAPTRDDSRWTEVLPKVPLGPSSRHLFGIPPTEGVNFVKLNMYPDGGIARFRVYGQVHPVHPANASEAFDLAHVFAGGRVEFTSDQHFGVGSNLILPGRGKDMGDGWETKRSRQKGHKDWAIIKLGAPGLLEQVEIDTAHFKGNFPESCELHALTVEGDADWSSTKGETEDWSLILPRTKLGPHRQHYFQLENVHGKLFTHVKVTIHPDGGIKRVRIVGTKGSSSGSFALDSTEAEGGQTVPPVLAASSSKKGVVVPVLPLTPEAFAPFGQVIQGYSDHAAVPKGTKITPANQGSASKFHKLSLLASSYPAEAGATTGLSVYRCSPLKDIDADGTTALKVLERHPFTNQAFIPMGKGAGEGLSDPGSAYLVVVAKTANNGQPDLSSVRAFVATAAQGIVYNTAVWHQPMTVLEKGMDFSCVETQIGDGSDYAENQSVTFSSILVSTAMESKKRKDYAHDPDATVSKKRVLSGPNGAPYVNGSASESEEPSDSDKLEMFRKEAIFRRMRHYSREYDRSQAHLAELERRKSACEVGLAAMAACWTQLLETIRLVAKPEDVPANTPLGPEIFDIASHISEDDRPELVSALQDNMAVTRTLVSRVANLVPSSGGDAYIKYQKAQAECAALRSEMHVMAGQLRDAESLKHRYHEQLQAAETAVDRLRSKTIMAQQKRAEKQENGGPTEEQKKPSSPVPSTSATNGHVPSAEHEDAMFLAELRAKQNAELLEEIARLKASSVQLSFTSKAPSAELVTESPHYKVLMDHTSYLTHTLSESQAESARLAEELQAMRDAQKEWMEAAQANAEQTNVELKAMMLKRDAENARLRDQRDQYQAELTERRQKDSVKIASSKEFHALAEARSARIQVLESQLSRYKAQLAANAGSRELLDFFFSGQAEDAKFIEEMKSRVVAAETQAAAVNQSLTIFQDDHPNVVRHMQAEADALQKLAAASTKLDNYERLFGDLPLDVAQLTTRIREQDEELIKLRLVNEQHEKEKAPVYSEIDQLSTAWEALERQLKSKVFDLKDLEDRLAKSGLEKAKSDNKFFAIMREKESAEIERKSQKRNLEKQLQVVERYKETDKLLNNQVLSLEKDLTALRRQYEVRIAEADGLKTENRELKGLRDVDAKRTAECVNLLAERDKELAERKAEAQKLSEDVALAKRETDKQAARVRELGSGSMSAREEDLQNELKKAMGILKCSTCKGIGFRDTVISKCGHTFCKACIDSRLATRQRKCPACNQPFAKEEVGQIFLQ
uniref:Allantoicase n=1 Tax=Mycena chlorophos TaxID=658473 RepID=A0ABQ0L0V9_MYCCL|nr:allantoicase [Mycena chlorophos]